ncbi:MAG TPA: 5-methyltetrahydropteroyltriglutamate--homocysteine methyltransferase, partial [Candidatus Binatia bacterium]|nr:5-methyltetrahydropteroyltriglutamate--homocysteine methyltransferase [Candidatus Binatia bacterium]
MGYARVPVKQAVISPSALSLMYPDQGFPVIRARSLSMILERARDRDPRCWKGTHKVQVDFTEGRLAIKIDPSGNLLQSFIDLNNLALARFSTEDRKRIGVHTCPGADAVTDYGQEEDRRRSLDAGFDYHL